MLRPLTRLRPSPLLVGVAVAIVAVAAGIAAYSWWESQSQKDAIAQDGVRHLLAASLPDITGQPQAFAQWRGKVLVVNFWATWCGPCREEMPELVQIQAQYANRGLQLVGVAIDQEAPVRAYVGQLPVNYPILVGGFEGMQFNELTGNSKGGLPYTLVIDRSGRLVNRYLGRVETRNLARTLDQLL